MFRLPKYALHFGVGALATLALTLAAPKAAHAIAATLVQVTNTAANPVINQDRDQQGRNFYQQSGSAMNQVATGEITFPSVPTGQRLIVQHVSGFVALPAAGTLAQVFLQGAGQQFLNYQLSAGNAGTFTYTFNEDVLASFDAGEVPFVQTSSISLASFQMVATISGYMISIP